MTSEALFKRALSAIALIGFGAVAGIIVLAIVENPVPDVLQNLAVGSLTALAGMLSRPPSETRPLRANRENGNIDLALLIAMTLIAAAVCIVLMVWLGDDLLDVAR